MKSLDKAAIGCSLFIGWLVIMLFGLYHLFFAFEELGLIICGIGMLLGIVILKKSISKEKSEVLEGLSSLKEESKDDINNELEKVKPEKVSGVKLEQIRKGDKINTIEEKGVINFYETNFSIDVRFLKGKVISYKYDDVVAETNKAGIMTMSPDWIWLYTSDGMSYTISFDSVADKLELVDRCKHLGGKKDDVSKTDSSSPASTADELKKFKELLDTGAITQEEYDEKKKKLLDL